MPRLALATAAALLAVGCGDSPRRPPCGIVALAGPAMLLEEFGVPGQTLGMAPRLIPERLVVRVAAGPAYRAVAGRTAGTAGDSVWVIGVEGALPERVTPGYGVLVLDRSDAVLGVVLFEGAPIQGAPEIGNVVAGTLTVPLLGLSTDPARFEDPNCPTFPDSLRS